MPYFFEEFLQALYEFLMDIVQWVLDQIVGWLSGLWELFVDSFQVAYTYAWTSIPQSWRDAILGIPWAEVVGYYTDVAWILPINSVLLIIGGTFAITAVVRLIRWVLGLLPTIGG